MYGSFNCTAVDSIFREVLTSSNSFFTRVCLLSLANHSAPEEPDPFEYNEEMVDILLEDLGRRPCFTLVTVYTLYCIFGFVMPHPAAKPVDILRPQDVLSTRKSRV